MDARRTSAISGYRATLTSQTCRSTSPSFDATMAIIVNAIEISHDGINSACICISMTASFFAIGHMNEHHRVPVHLHASRPATPVASQRESRPRFAAPLHKAVTMFFAQDRQSSVWAKRRQQKAGAKVCLQASQVLLVSVMDRLCD